MTAGMEGRLMKLLEKLFAELRIEQNRSGKLIANREVLQEIAACMRQAAGRAAMVGRMARDRYREPSAQRHSSTQTPRKVAVERTAA